MLAKTHVRRLGLPVVLETLGFGAPGWAGKPIELTETELYLELNDTDGDLGIHGAIDGGPYPFLWIVYELFVGLRDSIGAQPESARGLVDAARWLTVLSWSFYPVVFVFPMIGFTGGAAVTAVQVGYTVADIVAKAVFGVLIFAISLRESEQEPVAQAG